MDTYLLLNLAIECAGLVLCVVGLLQVSVTRWADRHMSRFFLLYFSSLMLLTLSNIAGQLMRGRPGPGWRAALYASNFIEFLSYTWLAVIASLYLISLVAPERKRRGLRLFVAAAFGVHVALLIVSQFTGLLYVIDAENVYHRSRWYPLCCVASTVMLLTDIGLLIRYRGRLDRRECLAMGVYFTVPLAAMILQLFVYGIYFVIFATIFVALVLYVFLITGQAERSLRRERELSDMRVRMLFNQIRPHLIFNVLTSIYVLCRDDPARAMDVIQDFSEYLHANFTAMAAEDLISFSDELHHTRAYLAVESIRYGDKLTVDYDIRHTAFRLPALTLQPLVENAVKYGVGSGRGPGTIVIRTAAEADGAVITVEDNGPGFDPAEAETGDHVGIRNVRERLDRMCSGTLEIVSSPGFGATVTVRIPSRRKGPERNGPARPVFKRFQASVHK